MGDRDPEGPLAHATLHEDGRVEMLALSGPPAPVYDATGVLTGVSQGFVHWSEAAGSLTAEDIRRARDAEPGPPPPVLFHPLDWERYVEAGYIDPVTRRLNYDKIAEDMLAALDEDDGDTDG